jgi:hypothetical protein
MMCGSTTHGKTQCPGKALRTGDGPKDLSARCLARSIAHYVTYMAALSVLVRLRQLRLDVGTCKTTA